MVEQYKARSANPEQITIFADMLKFFIAKTPLCLLKFTNFTAAVLIFTGFSFAAINVNKAGNAEIADFMESESNRILQVPDSSVLTINFQTAKDKHGRAGFLFFWGEREISIDADYVLAVPNHELVKGTIKADTSWFTGYCGMIECQNKPMPAQQRIDVLKILVSRLLTELGSNRLYAMFVEPKVSNSDAETANSSSTETASSSGTETADSLATENLTP
jgi:hypothetical protein